MKVNKSNENTAISAGADNRNNNPLQTRCTPWLLINAKILHNSKYDLD